MIYYSGDTAQYDMNHLPLKSGVILDLDDFGTVWMVYEKEG